MSSAPVNNLLDNPFFRFSPSQDDLNRRARTPGRMGIFGEHNFGSLPRGLAAASDTLGLPQQSGIVHKAQVRRNISPMTFVMPDTRKCPVCKKPDVEMYCASCLNSVFFQTNNVRRRRSELARRKANIGLALKERLEEPAKIQGKYYSTLVRVAELKEKVDQKRSLINRFKGEKESKQRNFNKIKQNVTELQKKCAKHKFTINEKRAIQQSLNATGFSSEYSKIIQIVYDSLSDIIRMEPVNNCAHDSDQKRVEEQIADALSNDKNTTPRYNEVAKRKLKTKHFYLVNNDFYVPSDGDYSEIVRDIINATGASLPQSTQDSITGLGYLAKFVVDLSNALDVFLPMKESIDILSQNPIWTKDQFETSIFALHLGVLLISLHLGVDAKQLSLKQPFNNLRLCREAMKNEKSLIHRGRLDHKDAIFNEITDSLATIKFTDCFSEIDTDGIECTSTEEGWEHVQLDN